MASLKTVSVYPTVDEQTESSLSLSGVDPTESFVAQLRARWPRFAGESDDLSGAVSASQDLSASSPAAAEAEAALRPLAQGTGATRPFIASMPESTFVRVVVDGGSADLAYSLLRARAHTNVAFMFREEARLRPELDYITLTRGPVGCYPNFIFRVPLAQVSDFSARMGSIAGNSDWAEVVSRWGVRRTHPSFWDDFEFFRRYLERVDPIEAGVLDANRYANF